MAHKNNVQNVAIIGAGLTGSLLGIYLRRRGYTVDIYERRPDMRTLAISAGRSINLAISKRGIAALERLGLDRQILRDAIPMHGRIVHDTMNKTLFQAYGIHDDHYINSLSRGVLNSELMTAAEKEGVQIHFNQRCSQVDFNDNRFLIIDERSHAETWHHFELIIGSDGSASPVRQSITSRPYTDFSQTYLKHSYKELTIAAGTDSTFQLDKNALHIWPRKSFMLIALPNPDATFTCTLFLPTTGEDSFESLLTPEDVTRFFDTHFSDAKDLIPDLTSAFFSNPTSALATFRCAPWHVDDRALLLGDAAHAVVPFFGQGMNCSFEDVEMFADLIDQHGGDFATILPEYSKRRIADANAIADMAIANFIEMRDHVGDEDFLLRKQVENALANHFNEQFVTRYQMVSFEQVPYRYAQQCGILQEKLLDSICDRIATIEDIDWDLAKRLVTAYNLDIRHLDGASRVHFN